MTLGKHSGFIPAALGFLLALWFCLAPTAARANAIVFNQAQAGPTSTYPFPTLYWSNSANWLPNAPANGDSVALNLTVSQTAAQMIYDVGTLNLSSLTVGAPTPGYLSLTLPAGANLTSGSETISGDGGIVQTGGTNTVGTLTLAANSSAGGVDEYGLAGGQLSATAIVNNSGGYIRFLAPGTFTYQSLVNEGFLGFSGSSSLAFYNTGYTVANPAGATLTNQNGGQMYLEDGSNGPDGTPIPFTFVNSGPGTSLSNLSGSTLTLYDTSLQNLNGATLTNGGAGTSLVLAMSGNTAVSLTNDGAGTHLYNQDGATISGKNLYDKTVGIYMLNQNGATLTNTGAGTTLYALVANGGPSSKVKNLAGATWNGFFYNGGGGTIINSGTDTTILMQNENGASNYGAGTNFVNRSGATVTIDNGLLANFSGATFINAGAGSTLNNRNGSTIYNLVGNDFDSNVGGPASTLKNLYGATLINDNSTLTNLYGSTLINDASTLTNRNGGSLNNTSFSYFYNRDGATLTNDNSSAAPQGTFINNTTGATFTNTGSNTNLYNQNGAQLSNTGWGTNFYNQAGATITNQTGAALTNQNLATFTNDNATLLNQTGGLLVNTGAGTNFFNQDGALLTNYGFPGGTPSTQTGLVNVLGATLTNTDAGTNLVNENGGLVINDASIINNVNGATLTNTDPGTLFDNRNGATLLNDSTSVVNNVNGAVLANESGAFLTNYGTLHNDATLNNSATVDNYGTIDTPFGTGIYNQTAGSTIVEASGAFTQDTLNILGGSFTDYGAVTITGNAANSGASLTIDGVTMTVDGAYSQTCAGCLTLLDGGLLDPTAIDIAGGTFGGAGAVVADTVTLNGSTLQVGDPTGQLAIDGDYSQTGGEIVFDIAPDGSGGFTESTLDFNSGANISFSNAVIEFDFIGGADETAFMADGLFNIDTFFQFSDGSDFWAYFGDIFTGPGDTFTIEGTNLPPTPLTFNSSNGDLGSSTPEPGTLFLLLPALGLLGFIAYRRRHPARETADRLRTTRS